MGDGSIRLGDPTTSGGKVIQASGFPSDGIPTALENDKASCPLHGGDFPIIGGYAFFKQSGRNTATEQLSKLACGCGLISTTAPTLARVEQAPSAARTALAPVSPRTTEAFTGPAAGPSAGQFDEHFIFVDAKRAEPLGGPTCLLIPEGAPAHLCTLDGAGRSHRHATDKSMSIMAARTAPRPRME